MGIACSIGNRHHNHPMLRISSTRSLSLPACLFFSHRTFDRFLCDSCAWRPSVEAVALLRYRERHTEKKTAMDLLRYTQAVLLKMRLISEIPPIVTPSPPQSLSSTHFLPYGHRTVRAQCFGAIAVCSHTVDDPRPAVQGASQSSSEVTGAVI